MNPLTVVRSTTIFFALAITVTLCVSVCAQRKSARSRNVHEEGDNKPACSNTFDSCPLKGCGDTNNETLNERKNISDADISSPTPTDLDDLRAMTAPASWSADAPREARYPHEGDVVVTVGWLMDIRKGSQESCNCYYKEPINTDNHMVLLTDSVINDSSITQSQWEKHSFTAEFTPRVKQKGHPNFDRNLIKPKITSDPRGRLWVRLTGTLMFDDYHEEHPLAKGRETNWEMHPVYKFEYCPSNKKCTLESDANWKNIEN